MKKKCTTCGSTMPIDMFYKSSGKHGVASTCKPCISISRRAYRAANADNIRAYLSRWRRDNTEKKRALDKSYRIKNSDRLKRQAKDYLLNSVEARRMRAVSRDRWIKKNPHKIKAHQTVGNAVRSGIIIKPSTCSACSITGTRIEGHHADYSKPLDITWLCSQCHTNTHMVVSR